MNKRISLGFLVIAIVLIVFGLNAYYSTASDFSRFFTGTPTDKSLWLLVGGLAVGAAGFIGLVRR
ncbi:MAG: hypothetical protein A2297_07925 [Elusimicrobia bacterium RIFOXYB2_FULL_48_7]|nr:MAG: hypothetical protein A2297_07925 [Elusimicrobia bacterium RIFOXYB2_FULL_48_7]